MKTVVRGERIKAEHVNQIARAMRREISSGAHNIVPPGVYAIIGSISRSTDVLGNTWLGEVATNNFGQQKIHRHLIFDYYILRLHALFGFPRLGGIIFFPGRIDSKKIAKHIVINIRGIAVVKIMHIDNQHSSEMRAAVYRSSGAAGAGIYFSAAGNLQVLWRSAQQVEGSKKWYWAIVRWRGV